MEQFKKAFTRTELNKLIKWSNSRYNDYKKADVVNDIIRIIESKQDVEKVYETGSFCEKGINKMTSGSNYGMTYKIKTKNVDSVCWIDLTLPNGEVIKRMQIMTN